MASALEGIEGIMEAVDSVPLRAFANRDYSRGRGFRFETKLPLPLTGMIDAAVFESTVNRINEILERAENQPRSHYILNCVSCMLGYTLECCIPNLYQKSFDEVTAFVAQEDEQVYAPLGLRLIDPNERAFRVLEVCARLK